MHRITTESLYVNAMIPKYMSVESVIVPHLIREGQQDKLLSGGEDMWSFAFFASP